MDGDSEDLIDPKLYFTAFKRTVDKKINYPEVDSSNHMKKNVNLCEEIAKREETQFNKSIVAKQFWPMLNDMSDEIDKIDQDSLERSIKNISTLIEKINAKFNT